MIKTSNILIHTCTCIGKSFGKSLIYVFLSESIDSSNSLAYLMQHSSAIEKNVRLTKMWLIFLKPHYYVTFPLPWAAIFQASFDFIIAFFKIISS